MPENGGVSAELYATNVTLNKGHWSSLRRDCPEAFGTIVSEEGDADVTLGRLVELSKNNPDIVAPVLYRMGEELGQAGLRQHLGWYVENKEELERKISLGLGDKDIRVRNRRLKNQDADDPVMRNRTIPECRKMAAENLAEALKLLPDVNARLEVIKAYQDATVEIREKLRADQKDQDVSALRPERVVTKGEELILLNSKRIEAAIEKARSYEGELPSLQSAG